MRNQRTERLYDSQPQAVNPLDPSPHKALMTTSTSRFQQNSHLSRSSLQTYSTCSPGGLKESQSRRKLSPVPRRRPTARSLTTILPSIRRVSASPTLPRRAACFGIIQISMLERQDHVDRHRSRLWALCQGCQRRLQKTGRLRVALEGQKVSQMQRLRGKRQPRRLPSRLWHPVSILVGASQQPIMSPWWSRSQRT